MANDKLQNPDYVKSITDIFTKDELYHAYRKDIEKGKSEARLIHRHNIKKIDPEWVEVIEDCLISLDTIVRNPRKFIVIEEDIIDISLAKSITTESVKHLAQHTNLISSVDKNGMVLPNKILNTSKEESYEVYENRFIYTLLLKLRDFVAKRFDHIKKAYLTSDEMLEISVDSAFNVGNKKMYYKQNLITALPSKEIIQSNANLSNLERVAKINRIIGDFFGSPFAKQMVSSALVRPPIQRTNVILKNQDFKKALMLWQFIETYNKLGFEVENKDDITNIDSEIKKRFLEVQYLNKLLFDAITSDKELAEGVDIVIDNKLMDLNSLLQDKKKSELEEPSQKQEEKPIEKPEQTNEVKQEEKQEELPQEEKQMQRTDEPEDDDYPIIAFDVPEVISLYQKNEDEKRVKKTDIKRINLAVDRVLLQKRILQAKSNKKLADKLRDQKKKIETKQKELAKRAKLAREQKAQREALRKQRTIQRQQEEKLLIAKREEKAREAVIRAQKRAVAEEEKEIARQKTEEAKQIKEQEALEYRQALEKKAAAEKQRLWEEAKAALISAERAAIAEKLNAKENKTNLMSKIRLENYKKALYNQYEKELSATNEAIQSATAKKIETIEGVLEEFNSYYGRNKKKNKEENNK